MLFGDPDKYNYPDDIFDQSRMSFGDHLDELRTRLRKALLGPFIFTILGLLLDGIGSFTGHPMIGIGKPMMAVITDPVTTMVRDFYARRNKSSLERLDEFTVADEETIRVVREKYTKYGYASLTCR